MKNRPIKINNSFDDFQKESFTMKSTFMEPWWWIQIEYIDQRPGLVTLIPIQAQDI
jgi:hypothetical protein